MFSRRRKRFSISSALTRRWIRSRPGSVLILVIALLVLLALIGTAYLSSTQTERYTSVQNTINTQADLLINGLVSSVEGRITGSLYGSGQTFRPPTQEMSFDGVTATPVTGYNAYTSPGSEDFMAERIPTLLSSTVNYPVWHGTSWMPFPDTNGIYTVDSPFDASLPLTNAANKASIVNIPTYRTISGKIYPAMLYYVLPPAAAFNLPTVNGGYYSVPLTGGYLTLNAGVPTVSLVAPTATVCGNASGDGIADAGLTKIPIGPIDGITYYGGIRIIDNNSAVNVSTAWSAAVDPLLTQITETTMADPTAKTTNYGFFRSNIGLRELLNTTTEMDYLNYYRFNNVFVASPSPINTPPTVTPALGNTPIDDTNTASTFSYYSTTGLAADITAGDPLETQLIRRLANPGYNTAGLKFTGLGNAQSAALAQRFSLVSGNSNASMVEQLLPYETLYNKGTGKLFPSAPFSPSQVISPSYSPTTPLTTPSGYWFDDLFNFSYPFVGPAVNLPIRTMLTASNPVSNGIPSRYGNTTTGGVAYSTTATYNFGDWVTLTSTTGVVTSYACIQPILIPGSAPLPVSPATSTQYWTLVPWSYQPVKASINTATFEQLYLNFCHVMTDTVPAAAADVTATGTLPQWQPPLMPKTTVGYADYAEEQMPQFRSVIRDNRKWPLSNSGNTGQPYSLAPGGQSPGYASQRVQMTPMQMMQLRAAIAAINTVSIRDINKDIASSPLVSKHMTRSRRVILTDTSGNPAFEAEVFGNDIQPYINQMYAQVNDPNDGPTNFIAIQLINPNPTTDITVGPNWVFATVNRLATNPTPGNPNFSLTSVGTGNTGIIIPKASLVAGVLTPGSVTLYDGAPPAGFTLPTASITTGTPVAVSGLAQGIGNELMILRPRRLDGTLTKAPTATAYFDRFDETTAGHIYDLVPVDQLDMSGLNNVPQATNNIYYRRAADQTPSLLNPTFAWNFTWPGFFTPYNSYNTIAATATYMAPPHYTPTSAAITTYPFNQPFIATATPPSTTNTDFTKLCMGKPDPAIGTATAPTYNTITLQLANTSLPGVNPVDGLVAANNRFPFGGFARNGDLLQIPFIGAYRIIDYHRQMDDTTNNPSQQFYEMNSVTMDASLANDSTLQTSLDNSTGFPSKVIPSTAGSATPLIAADAVGDPFVEQIGHFCPVGDTSPSTYTYTSALIPAKELDFGAAPSPAIPSQYWHYHWAKRLFDYFTVQAPHDDYFPNADPDLSYANYGDVQKFTTTVPKAVSNAAGTANVGEDIVGVEGLININTAPWPVLATLPFVPRNALPASPIKTDYLTYNNINGGNGSATITVAGTADGREDNVEIAQAIVDYRNAHGPFKSIMDLYNVPAFRLENDALLSQATEPSVAQGDFSPSGIDPSGSSITMTDGARYDFEERFLLLNQISNLITTRSDTFTCYVDLQGWRNVGTGNPTLAVERRTAFLFDRNSYAPTFKNPVYFHVPGN